MKKDRMDNPNYDGVVIVETKGKNSTTEAYRANARYSKKFIIPEDGWGYRGPWNPNKIVFYGEEITVYAKNATIKFKVDGSAEFLPVEAWDYTEHEKQVVENKLKDYKLL